jgi:hypothetical protein
LADGREGLCDSRQPGIAQPPERQGHDPVQAHQLAGVIDAGGRHGADRNPPPGAAMVLFFTRWRRFDV